jgi:Uncharacterized protein conserved in bacteria (DUF2147)
MKRLSDLAVLMMLGSSASSAQAGDSYSLLISGHRIHIEARRGCRSLSCVSWSDAGKRNRRDRDDDAAPAEPTVTTARRPQPQPAPVERQPQPARATLQPPPPPRQQQAEPVQQAQLQSAPTPPMPAPQVQIAPQLQVAPLPPASDPAPVVTAPPATKVASETVMPPPAAPKPELKTEAKIVVLEEPAFVSEPAPPPTPAKLKDEKETADTPLGDWQTEGNKGLVRIEQCGKSLCSYVLNASSNTKGETVLANMKSKSDNTWTGDIYSRASGKGYYAKMTLKAPNKLHVEACAVLRFFCSGNDWTRIVSTPNELLISRQSTSEPSS